MLAMHNHDNGATHFLSRSTYHQPDDLATDSVLKYQHHMNYLYQHTPPQLHQQLYHLQHQQQQALHHVEQSQPHHLLPLYDDVGAHPARDRSFAEHDTVLSPLSYNYSFQQPPHQHVTSARPDRHAYHPAFTSSQPTSTGSCVAYDETEAGEDVDEDDISETEDDDMLRSYEQFRLRFHAQAPDVTSQLLQFADTASADIQKFFGRAKGHEDGCDVYEDKWTTTKSGRELYYADLLRIAQGDSEPASRTTKKSLNSSSTAQSTQDEQCRPSSFSGRRNTSAGIGPLNELFQLREQNYCIQKKSNYSKSKPGSVYKHHIVPMNERDFPESFWREPCKDRGLEEQRPVQVFNSSGSNDPCVQSMFNATSGTVPGLAFGDRVTRTDHAQRIVMASSKLPDFADLVESWQGSSVGAKIANTGHDRRHVLLGSVDPRRL